MPEQNCWEFKKCGREPGGAHVQELGVCPAATETRVNGVHGGKNGGRTCWMIAGTMCTGEVIGTYAAKMTSCQACDFYQQIQRAILEADPGRSRQPGSSTWCSNGRWPWNARSSSGSGPRSPSA